MDTEQWPQGGASEFAFYRTGFTVPGPRSGLAEPGRRAALGDSLRRPAAEHDSAGERGIHLGTRRVSGLGLRFGDDSGGARPGRRASARPFRDAALLRL